MVHRTLSDSLSYHLFQLIYCSFDCTFNTWWHHLPEVLWRCYWTHLLDIVFEQALGCKQRVARSTSVWTQLYAFAVSSKSEVKMRSVRWPASVARYITYNGKVIKQTRSPRTCRPRKCVSSFFCFAPLQTWESSAWSLREHLLRLSWYACWVASLKLTYGVTQRI